MPLRTAEDFVGTHRFEVRRRLGAGGFGIVYEAMDQDRGAVVALKALRHMSPRALYRFKNEFRALAGVSHPNLVSLHELLAEDDRWFFTMELVPGVDFLSHARGAAAWGGRWPADDFSSPTSDSLAAGIDGAPARGPSRAEAGAPLADGGSDAMDRLRAALPQLVEGLAALHAAGMLHRDVKPSNVLVTPAGRVVLLDFGLVRGLERDITQTGETVGTPAYMAPEQAAGAPVSEASDWYSVGVMLYEALFGCLPFAGTVADLVRRKQEEEASPPPMRGADVPDDLAALCRDLLRRDPSERPGATEILERLSARDAGRRGKRAAPTAATPGAPFVGREWHLALLHEAYAASRNGRAATVAVYGGSGIGKSALVRRFLDEVRARDSDAIVLAGRCYERESVPYKAIDPLIDSLSRFLKSLPPAVMEALLPHDVLALARVFPVLRQVEAVASARRAVLDIPDSQELRLRAFGALRELLVRLSDRRPVVLVIDDLQWGDVDSAFAITELLRPPDPPAVMVIGCYRAAEAESSPLLRALLPLRERVGHVIDNRELAVGELSQAEACDLALAVLGGAVEDGRSRAEGIVAAVGGNPFFIHEVARFSDSLGAAEPAEAPARAGTRRAAFSLDAAIGGRIARLPEPARRMLSLLAVAGQPLDVDLVTRAAALEGGAEPALAALRAAHLARTRTQTGSSREEIETYHDRIREVVLARLGPEEIRAEHARLAAALESSGRVDPEVLAAHHELAGDTARAAEYALAAAMNADEALAFDRAARLYRVALALDPVVDGGRRALVVRLAEALANAGRGAEAAQCYLDAVRGATPAESVELHRRAAQHLLTSGHVEEGARVMRTVLASLGMRLPETSRAAALSLLLGRARLALRGLRFRERDQKRVAPRDLLRVDACWSVAVGFGMVDMVRGADFQARHLLLALKAGEPYRVARALALEAGYAALAGTRSQKRGERIGRASAKLAARVGHPHAIALSTLTAGIAAWTHGRWRDARRLVEEAEAQFRERCTGVVWEIDMAQMYGLAALFFLGEVAELSRRLPVLMKDAVARGDLLALTNLRLGFFSHIAWLAADDPATAREELQAGLDGWSGQRFDFPRIWARGTQRDIALYSGEPLLAPDPVAGRARGLARVLDRFTQAATILGLSSRARRRLGAAAEMKACGEREQMLAGASAQARAMERERTEWGAPLAMLVHAGVAATRGEAGSALGLLARAESGLRASEMALHLAAARRRRGELTGGDGGRRLVEESSAWMSGQGIRNPARMSALLTPGAWSRP